MKGGTTQLLKLRNVLHQVRTLNRQTPQYELAIALFPSNSMVLVGLGGQFLRKSIGVAIKAKGNTRASARSHVFATNPPGRKFVKPVAEVFLCDKGQLLEIFQSVDLLRCNTKFIK